MKLKSIDSLEYYEFIYTQTMKDLTNTKKVEQAKEKPYENNKLTFKFGQWRNWRTYLRQSGLNPYRGEKGYGLG